MRPSLNLLALPMRLVERVAKTCGAALRWAMLIGLSGMLSVSFAPASAQTTSSSFGLDQLMQMLAQVKRGDASFTEVRHVTMLEHTLESSGRLHFEVPDTFVRETLKPRQERVAVIGDTLTMSLGSRSRSVPLESVPEAAVMVDAIRGTLTGNRDAIERHFEATVTGNAAHWSLSLVPRDGRLREEVNAVHLSGRQAALHEMVVNLSDGDRSVMTITPSSAASFAPSSFAPSPSSVTPIDSSPSAPR